MARLERSSACVLQRRMGLVPCWIVGQLAVHGMRSRYVAGTQEVWSLRMQEELCSGRQLWTGWDSDMVMITASGLEQNRLSRGAASRPTSTGCCDSAGRIDGSLSDWRHRSISRVLCFSLFASQRHVHNSEEIEGCRECAGAPGPSGS